jgi:hypothetical protein
MITPTALSSATTTWTDVADYQSDFQVVVPSDGWTYAWNPAGKLGNANGFTPLKWNATAQAYKTTAGSTKPSKKKKKKQGSDYLLLQTTGGHPGNPGYLPIVGYTIQSQDGAGLYQLSDSSIAKGDGKRTKKEDGLGVLVYINNSLLGPMASVSTNGQVATFDRNLGELGVGDTIWVMVNPLKNNQFDAFKNFDFTIAKLTTVTEGENATDDSEGSLGSFPEPSTAILLFIAAVGHQLTRRRK